MNAPRRALRRILSTMTLAGFAVGAVYGTFSFAGPPVSLGDGVVLLKTAVVTASTLTNAARTGLHRTAVAAVVVSAKSASRTAVSIAKASAESAREHKVGGCPLRNSGSCPACAKRSNLGA